MKCGLRHHPNAGDGGPAPQGAGGLKSYIRQITAGRSGPAPQGAGGLKFPLALCNAIAL